MAARQPAGDLLEDRRDDQLNIRRAQVGVTGREFRDQLRLVMPRRSRSVSVSDFSLAIPEAA